MLLRKGNYQIKKNIDLWSVILAEKDKFADIKFIWVKGHGKNQHNIEVDKRAVMEARKS